MYEVSFDKKIYSFLRRIPKEDSERIFRKIISAKENPLRFFEQLKGSELYKLRIGDYRAIADIDNNERKIKVRLVGHRKNIYDKISSIEFTDRTVFS